MSAPRAAGEGHLLVTQVRSYISTKPKHRATLRALGLRGVGRSHVLADKPEIRGMLARVDHLVKVEPATAELAARQLEAQSAARQARRRAQSSGDPGATSASTASGGSR